MSAAPLPPAKPATRTPRTLRNAIFCLALAAFASGSSLRLTDSLLPRLANDFEISLGTASYTITAFSIAYGLAQLLFGPLGDRFGKYLTIAAACAAGVVTTVLCALAPNFPLLLVARFLAGCTAAAVIPLSMAWIGDVIPYEDRQPVLARFLIGQILGLSSGVLIGGWAADHSSWRLPFYAIALLYAAVSAILFSLNRQLPAEAKRTVKSTGPAIPRMISEFGQVLSKPWARVVLASVFMEGMFLYGAFAFIASHLHHVHGMSLTAAGSMVMLFGLGGFLFAIGSGVLVRRLGEVWLVRVGGLVAAVALVTIGLAPDWTWVIPACGALGLGFYMLHNTLQINATQMAPERRGAAVASFASCFFLGQSSGIAMAAWLIASFGTSAVIAGFGMGLLLVAWIFSLRKARYLAKSEL